MATRVDNVPGSLFRAMVAIRDLILVTGKGGTGKSTVCATLAELAARQRGAALAVEMSAHARLPEMLGPESRVRSLRIDAEEAVLPALGRLLGLPALVTRIFSNRFLRLFIRTSPAIREMIMLDELYHLVTSHTAQRCPVIVDLPSSGHALSILETPLAVHRLLRVGPLSRIAAQVEQLLLDRSRCELVVVTLPEELPVNETIEVVRRAQEIGLVNRTVVVNQVPFAALEPEDGELLDLLCSRGDAELVQVAETARNEIDEVAQSRLQIDRLCGAIKDGVIELPLHRDPDPRRCVSSLLQGLS
jgi:arsenite/tail-anchored protein-transporting ATPase